MLIYFHIDPDETLGTVQVKSYPALTAIAGSPFSGASITDLLLGQYSVNIGAVTGNWKLFVFNSDGDQIAYGFASSDYTDASGNATMTDYAPWLSIPIVDPASGTSFESGTVQINQGDSYDDVANAKLIWAVAKDYRAWTGVFTIRHRVTNTLLLSVDAVATSAVQVDVALTANDTEFFGSLVSDPEFGPHPYDVEFTSGASKETPLRGRAIVYRLTAGALPDSDHTHFGGTIT